MYKFEYDIRINEQGRPYLHLDDNESVSIEDKFMALELSRYLLYNLIENDPNNVLTDQDHKVIATAGNVVTEFSDKIAILVKGNLDAMNEVNDILNDDGEGVSNQQKNKRQYFIS